MKIITDRLILRRFSEADAEDLPDILRDEKANAFLPWFALRTLDEAKLFLKEQFLDYYEAGFFHRYAVCKKENNEPVGYVWVANDESCDFGYGLKSDFWHQGLATEAAKEVVDILRKAGYAYITATHDVNNYYSGRVMKKIGMKYRYSYTEQWQPKDITVTFRMYQLNFDGHAERTYSGYWEKHGGHVEEGVL